MTEPRLLTKKLTILGAAMLYDRILLALDKRRLDLVAIRALRKPLSANRLHRDVVQRAFFAAAGAADHLGDPALGRGAALGQPT